MYRLRKLIIAITCVVAIAAIAFILSVRPNDLPAAEPESPFRHLDERKAAIYENLRDLQFEYRVGKLSDGDYQATKRDLQTGTGGGAGGNGPAQNGVTGDGRRTGDRGWDQGWEARRGGFGGRAEGFVCPCCGANSSGN